MTQSKTRSVSLDPFSCEVLEFPAIVELVRGYLTGSVAVPLLRMLAPSTDLLVIQRDHALAAEARQYLRASPRPGLGSLQDPRFIFDKLRVEGTSLTPFEILAVLAVARAAGEFHRLFASQEFPRLREMARTLADLRDLVADLDGKILPDGSVDSSASHELTRIRRAMERLRTELQAKLENLLHHLSATVLQDAVVSIRNDRFVIPIRVEEKRHVPGVVHGASSSGASVFVEPLETLPLNNELVELQDREFVEIQRILGEFSEKLRARQEELGAATEILSELDLTFAKAEFARQYDCCFPKFVTERKLGLREARHPLLEKTLRSRQQASVPLDIELEEPKTLMVVSGPNTGGKTVTVKTVGLAVLMAQAGLPVMASAASLPLYGRVLADIGDQQSIEASLSTFSAHVTNIEAMVEVADRNDLVLLDELGGSTEPNEGAALAIAILDHFCQRGAMTFVTTHHARLKAFAAETSAAVNAATEFDEATLQPTYRLLLGLPGKSSALDTAARLGLRASIVEKARSLLGPSEAESSTLIARLHEQKEEFELRLVILERQTKALDARRAELESKYAQERGTRIRELDKRFEETLRQYEKRWEAALTEIRTRAGTVKPGKSAERKGASLRGEAREEWNASVLEVLGAPEGDEPAPRTAPLAVGDRVRLAQLSTPGTVIGLPDDDQVEVEVGRMRMRVHRNEVRVLPGSRVGAAGPQAVMAEAAEAPVEINVIGCTAEEAREQVDEFLDRAFVAGRFRLRVVHGHGKGILRRSLHEMFSSHPHVEKYYPATPPEGGTGATIVELKI